MRPPAYVTTSWDDGHPLDLRVAELLTRHGLRGTFYVPRKIDSGAMSESQLQELGRSFEIGAHTLNHVFLTQTDFATAQEEIIKSKSWVEQVTGSACTVFCPPAGKYTAEHARMIRRAGYAGLRSVEFMSLDFPRLRDGLLEMPTTIQAFPQPAKAYLKNAIKRFALRNLWLYVVHGHSTDWEKLTHSMVNHMLRHGGVFHLWGHSWELEGSQQWQRLGEVLRFLGDVAQEAPCLTNGQVFARVKSPGVLMRKAQAFAQ